MDVTKTFADPDLEQDGVWVEYRDDSRVKLARIGNKRFQRLFEERTRPLRRKKGFVDPEKETRALCEVISETVLLDWSGFEGAGKSLKYSKETAMELLLRHMDFRDEIVELATQEERYRRQEEEDAAKN